MSLTQTCPFDIRNEPLEEAARRAGELFVEIYRGLEQRHVSPAVERYKAHLGDDALDRMTCSSFLAADAAHGFEESTPRAIPPTTAATRKATGSIHNCLARLGPAGAACSDPLWLSESLGKSERVSMQEIELAVSGVCRSSGGSIALSAAMERSPLLSGCSLREGCKNLETNRPKVVRNLCSDGSRGTDETSAGGGPVSTQPVP
jgi:hypothetical protein